MAQLPGEARRVQYTATDSQTVFIYDYLVYADDEITVQQNSDTLALTADYTVQDAGETTGGTVTLVTGATTGDIITLTGNTMIERETTFTTGGDFLASAINAEYDRLDNIAIEFREANDDTFRLVVFDEDVSKTIPSPSARKSLIWNTAATALENSTYDPDEQVDLAKAEVVKCQDEVVKCQDEVVLAKAEVVKCQDEVVLAKAEVTLCEAETTKCVAETAKCEAETAKCVTETALASGFADDASDSADEAAASAASINLPAVASDVVPDTNNTRYLGSFANRWKYLFTYGANFYGEILTSIVKPMYDSTYSCGTPDFRWLNGYFDNVETTTINGNPISGTAEAMYTYDVAQGTNGGTYTTVDTWQTRPVDEEVYDAIGCSVASNKITIPAGSYMIDVDMICYSTDANNWGVYDTTGAAYLWTAVGTFGSSVGNSNVAGRGYFTVGVQSDIEIRQNSSRAQVTVGMGKARNVAGMTERYLTVLLRKVA